MNGFPAINFACSYRRCSDLLARLVELLAILCGLVMVGSLLLGVFYRYILSDALSWANEVAVLTFTWSVFLAAALVVRDHGHVRIEFIDLVLPHWLVRLMSKVTLLAVIFVCGYLIYSGIGLIELSLGTRSAAIQYPVWMLDASIPVGGALSLFYAVERLLGAAVLPTEPGPGA